MQREIKFRAWDNVLKTWLSDLSDAADPVRKENCTSQLRPTKNVILMQFTGLKDKNGTEIYEGDILRGFGSHKAKEGPNAWKVFWDAACASWWLERQADRYTRTGLAASNNDELVACEYQVIGNIYENPELLK